MAMAGPCASGFRVALLATVAKGCFEANSSGSHSVHVVFRATHTKHNEPRRPCVLELPEAAGLWSASVDWKARPGLGRLESWRLVTVLLEEQLPSSSSS